MPKKPLYRQKPDSRKSKRRGQDSPKPAEKNHSGLSPKHPRILAPSHFELRDDGSIVVAAGILPAVEPGFQPGGRASSHSKAHDDKSTLHPGGRMPPSPSGRMPDATAPRL
ncbi:MAG TPA: hypothetical protein VMH30_00020, partial [Verrucomicrobiae bacterium]|nr:hypothetical protein [Verrucomicrobiae bacterium]